MAAYEFPELINFDDDATEYRFLTNEHVRSDVFRGKSVLIVDPDGLQLIAKQAFADVSFYFRRSHLEKLAAILDDGETSQNDRFVAASLLRNAAISAQGELPSCQDTGTATIVAYKGEGVFTGANDKSHLSRGVISTFKHRNLRSSQMVPLAMFEEVKSDFNQPIQIDIYATVGNEYRFLFIAKGGGSSNTTALYQESKALLNDEAFESKADGVGSLWLSAVSHRYCGGWDVAGDESENGEAGLGRISRSVAGKGRPKWPGFPGYRTRKMHSRYDKANRIRGAIWREILRPGRSGDTHAAACRLMPRGNRSKLLCRQEHQGKNHSGRLVPGKARQESGTVSGSIENLGIRQVH